MRLERLSTSPMLGKKWKSDDPRYKNKGRICDVPGCEKPFYAKGLCQKHHASKRHKGFLASKINIKPVCSIEGCEEESTVKGFCNFHYTRHLNGTPFDRPKGLIGELNPNWNGGVAQYPNHSQMKRIRKVVLEEAEYICHYCGDKANEVHHKDLSKDNHSRDNLVACCHSCNLKRRKPDDQCTSKYKRIYGKTQKKIAKELGCSASLISIWHKKGKLKSKLTGSYSDPEYDIHSSII